jgi:hypothetical protein
VLSAGKDEHADDPATGASVEDDDPPTEFIDVHGMSAPTQALPRQTPPHQGGRHHLPEL